MACNPCEPLLGQPTEGLPACTAEQAGTALVALQLLHCCPALSLIVSQPLAATQPLSSCRLRPSPALPPGCRGCLEKDTLEWVAETAAALPRVPTSLAFVHIPLPQILEVFNNGTTNGKKEGDSGCPIVDTGGFDVLK